MPELGQDRPAQDTDVATAALEAKMIRNHRFFKRNLIGPGHVPELGQDKAAKDTDVARASPEAKMVGQAIPRCGQGWRYERGEGPRQGGKRKWGVPTVDTQATQPQAQKWPEQRWSRKWSESIGSLIRT